jgi:hypothetical protein
MTPFLPARSIRSSGVMESFLVALSLLSLASVPEESSASTFSIASVTSWRIVALSRSLAHQLWPEGIHIANVLVDGSVAKPSQRNWSDTLDEEWIHPDHVADSY